MEKAVPHSLSFDCDFLHNMMRRRLPLEYVAANSARKVIFTKRKKGLFKKLHEISTLCGITACVVIRSASDTQPEIWPPSHTIVRGILTKYKEIPEAERAKRRISLEDYITGRIATAEAQRMELIRDAREKEMTRVMNSCLSMETLVSSLPVIELNDLRFVIDSTVTKLGKRIEMLKSNVYPEMAPLVSDDDGLTAGEMSNPLGEDDGVNSSNIHDGFWSNAFCQ